MPYFKAKMHKIRFRLGFAPDPAGELTALPQTPSWILGGLLLRGGEGGEGKGRGKGRGGEREGRGKGRGREGQEKRPVFWFCVVGNPIVRLQYKFTFTKNWSFATSRHFLHATVKTMVNYCDLKSHGIYRATCCCSFTDNSTTTCNCLPSVVSTVCKWYPQFIIQLVSWTLQLVFVTHHLHNARAVLVSYGVSMPPQSTIEHAQLDPSSAELLTCHSLDCAWAN